MYATLLLSLYILDTVEAGVFLAMGSAYLNLHQLRYLISSDNYMKGRAILQSVDCGHSCVRWLGNTSMALV